MGVILGKIGENALAQALSMLDYNFWDFITEAVSGLFVIAGVLTVVVGIYRHARKYFGFGKRS